MPKTGEEIKNELEAKYDVGLSFGYIGNCERWGDDRRWYFFTLVPDPNDRHGNRFSWGGGVRTEDLPAMLERAERELEQWIIDKVMPHQANRSRPFRVDVPHSLGPLVYRELGTRYGLGDRSYGMRGHNCWQFYLRGVSLAELTEFVVGVCGTSEGVSVKESAC